MSVQHLNTQSFQALLETSTIPILVDFFATWCGPCKMLAPVLEEISNEREDVVIVKIDVDEEPGLAQAFGVQVIPTLFVVTKEGVSAPVTGYRDKAALNAMLDAAQKA